MDPAAGEYMDADIAVAGQLYVVTGNLLHRMFASKMIQGCCCYITGDPATIASHSRASYYGLFLIPNSYKERTWLNCGVFAMLGTITKNKHLQAEIM